MRDYGRASKRGGKGRKNSQTYKWGEHAKEAEKPGKEGTRNKPLGKMHGSEQNKQMEYKEKVWTVIL